MSSDRYQFHEVANIFPMMSADEYDALKEDIRANGLLEPIWLYEDKIIDGRNRYCACVDVGATPAFRQYSGDSGPALVAFVVSMNLKRRHLDAGQKAFVALEIEPLLAQYAKERMSESRGPLHQKFECTSCGASYWHDEGHICKGSEKIQHLNGKAAEQAAAIVGTNAHYVADAKRLTAIAPDLAAKVKAGEMKMPQAIQEMRRAQVVAQLESVEEKTAKELVGVYDVIVIDPPWPMEKIERDVAPNQVAFEYPTMTLEEIAGLKIPAAYNCHVWMWTTQKFLPDALAIVDTWGLNYVCTFVWHKPGGFQPFGLPQYNAEFAIYARKGSPKFIDLKDFKLCFDAPRGAHSEKPELFYNTVRRVTAGRRLDMFNRRSIDGFDGWGKESK